MMQESFVPEPDDDDDAIDGCDVEFDDAEATPDEELPAAEGGVMTTDEDDDMDGCDVEFGDEDATSDEELPTASGGVA